MVSYLSKILVTVLFSFFVIYSYYSQSFHNESFSWYTFYLVSLVVVYSIYRGYHYLIWSKKIVFTPLKIFWYFSLHLLILSVFTFSLSTYGWWYGVTLFLKILSYCILPFIIVIVSLGFWKKLVSMFLKLDSYGRIFDFLLSLWVWFSLFLFCLTILGFVWLYNIYIFIILILGFWIFAYREIIDNLKWIYSYEISFDIDEGKYLKLISTELLFIVATLLLSVNLINIVRAFPIGWDDLWAYMNIPNLLVEQWNLFGFAWMYTWQIFTGIWYMFGSATQAFFLNNVWWFLSFIALVLIVSDLLSYSKEDKEGSYLNVPFLVATIFISMPMVIFELAKDMKLDPGLFFFSVVTLYIFYKFILINSDEKWGIKWIIMSFIKWWDDEVKNNYKLLFVIWFLAWFVFSVKFTSLMLISAIIGVLFFVRFWLLAFLWYLWVFFAIFTKLWLWKYMNVVYPKDNMIFVNAFSLVSLLVWGWFLAYGFYKNKKVVKSFFIKLSILLFWIIVSLSPWFIKNIVSAYPEISVWKLVSWKADIFSPDYTKIHSSEELKQIEWDYGRGVNSSGTTSNEDFGRYFGYELWVNNHIKLPRNLTMQLNQRWEFTDITYIFLALIPVLFLFLPFRNKKYAWFVGGLLILELMIFIKVDDGPIESSKLSELSSSVNEQIFTNNNLVLKDRAFGKDIYDLKASKYIKREALNNYMKTLPEWSSYSSIRDKMYGIFYDELRDKVIGKDNSWVSLKVINWWLSLEDFKYIEELKDEYQNYSLFNSDIDSLGTLDKFLSVNWVDGKEKILELWKENRSFNQLISDLFASFELPVWYVVILLFFLAPLIYFIYTIEENKIWKLFLINLVFFSFYTFLWTISAFWIVWYGIVMYFCLLLMIWLSVFELSKYSDKYSENENYVKLLWSFVVFLLVFIYFVNSSLPHGLSNLKSAGHMAYKAWKVDADESIFVGHKDYLNILFELNIKDESKKEFLLDKIKDDDIKRIIKENDLSINQVMGLLDDAISKTGDNKFKAFKKAIYKWITYPENEYKSDDIIYRIGTFLKYYITENNKRIFEDNLVTLFDKYIFNEDIDKTVDNINRLGLSYFLVDLNAATIDRDPRHDLTRRYENLLATFTSNKLELIDTDSICLKIALEDYKKSNGTLDDLKQYMFVAGVNHESYTEDGKVISRWDKLYSCYSYIFDLIQNDKVDTNNYNYLMNMKSYTIKNGVDNKNDFIKLANQVYNHGYKVLFKVN